MAQARRPYISVLYDQKEITSAIDPFLLSLSYEDKVTGESDEINLVFEDSDALWKGSWYPSKGDTLTVSLGYAGEDILPCGDFEIDEIEAGGPPDTVTIKGLAAGIKHAVRTRRSAAYEKRTLRQIAQTVADRHGLALTGSIADVKIEHISQLRQTDLGFLFKLANTYGYSFSIRGKQLVFYKNSELLNREPVLIIKKTQCQSYLLRDKSQNVYKAAEVAYHDPQAKELISFTQPADVVTGDVLKISERCESREQAQLKAEAALTTANRRQVEGNLTLSGEVQLVAGNNITLEEFGNFDGRYAIAVSRHTVSRSAGYTTEIEVSKSA
jgi:phage protein D